MGILQYSVLFSSIFTSILGLYCLTCSDIDEAKNCASVTQCTPGQVCYNTQLLTPTGTIYRQLGCRDATKCMHGVMVGKRQSDGSQTSFHDSYHNSTEIPHDDWLLRTSAGDSMICDECCNTDMCRTGLCSDTAAIQLGPVCFNCDSQLPSEPCTKINRCDSDEFCFKSLSQHSGLLQSGCTFGTACEHHQLLNSQYTCFTCCERDLCNENCSSHNVPDTTPGDHCIDHTPMETCQLASVIVCQDKAHAKNAGCSHYCGFC